jgi:uncharacterized protein
MKTRELTVPAPADLGIDMLGAPEGSPIDLDLRLEAVVEGVLATAVARATLHGQCVRCLDPIEDDLEVRVQELYLYPDSEAEDDDAPRMVGDLFDFEPALRDAVVLALPFGPTCEPDCPGLCVECGARLADDPGHSHGDEIDPRWVGLTDLMSDDADAMTPMASEDEE